jgi:hypothetical protein
VDDGCRLGVAFWSCLRSRCLRGSTLHHHPRALRKRTVPSSHPQTSEAVMTRRGGAGGEVTRAAKCAARGAATSSRCEKCGAASRHISNNCIPREADAVCLRNFLVGRGCSAGNAEGVRLQGTRSHNLKNRCHARPDQSWQSGERSHHVPYGLYSPLELSQAAAETCPRCPETTPRRPLAIDNPLCSVILPLLPHRA